MKPTHTFAVLPVSQNAFDEIRDKLKTAAYDHCFIDEKTISLQGIAIRKEEIAIGKASAIKTKKAL